MGSTEMGIQINICQFWKTKCINNSKNKQRSNFATKQRTRTKGWLRKLCERDGMSKEDDELDS
jgi:hypothetical protein